MTPPPHLQSLLDAYIAATGLPVTLSLLRAQMLTDLYERGVRVADVRPVLDELKRLGLSLDFRNAMNPDTFEERALRLRQRLARRPKPKVFAPARIQISETQTQTTMQEQASPEPRRIDIPATFRGWADEIGRNGN